jgi:mono/diheme cytochrome c family protein
MVLDRHWIFVIVIFLFYSCGSDNGSESNRRVEENKSEVKKKTQPGEIVYMQFCLSCHMQNGEGVPGLYPPLTQTKWVLGDKDTLIQMILEGQQGPIEVKGKPYNNIMTKLDFLGDKQIAEVLTYVRSNFGNDASPVTPQEVKAVRDSLGK